jgi:hypothetical protein
MLVNPQMSAKSTETSAVFISVFSVPTLTAPRTISSMTRGEC